MPGDWGPGRYDKNRELMFVRPILVGATQSPTIRFAGK
jgi:hypothetical protein